ncbi:hypothetical protein E4U43_004308 [Claviceps pusilla]|uniref:G-protein coupled receptors family 2 profile 2 domain-containing protein n=1 Tax=Claviceps pusilla TaxID=123648 RepID=A0A9P7N5Q2_9HYPO|nr:hypothetical protein E4U43_004308 [Claviceps pusilla]
MESSDDGSKLSAEHTNTLITIERTGASLSMAAIVLTVIAYLSFSKLKTTPNTFLVFASVANAGASIASMMGYDGLRMGVNSPLCQAQGFIFEWFMQADPWWSCAMAVNVFLVFFNNADPSLFQHYTWVYCIICFGGPMVPAVVLVSVRGDPKGPMIGDAALWCWISPSWSIVRLYAYYIPIWICIMLSIIIYIAVGLYVFRRRNQLRNFEDPEPMRGRANVSLSGSESRFSGEEIFPRRNACYGTAFTEVNITVAEPDFDFEGAPTFPASVLRAPSRVSRNDSQVEFRAIPTQTVETTCSYSGGPSNRTTRFGRLGTLTATASMKLKRLDPVKMSYLRTSFIFALSVLITWIPSSVNRLYSLANQGQVSYSLSVASGCVLPLQGVWNAIIFFTTSWSSVQAEARALKARFGHGCREYPRGTTRLDSRLGLSPSTDTSDEFGERHEDCAKKWSGGDKFEMHEQRGAEGFMRQCG